MNKYQEAFERFTLHTEQLQKFQLVDDRTFNKGLYEQDKESIKELVDKATPLEPDILETLYICKCCNHLISKFDNYCSVCGTRLKEYE